MLVDRYGFQGNPSVRQLNRLSGVNRTVLARFGTVNRIINLDVVITDIVLARLQPDTLAGFICSGSQGGLGHHRLGQDNPEGTFHFVGNQLAVHANRTQGLGFLPVQHDRLLIEDSAVRKLCFFIERIIDSISLGRFQFKRYLLAVVAGFPVDGRRNRQQVVPLCLE